MMKKTLHAALLVAAGLFPAAAFACTSAIVAANANPSGRPILWKHRDTSNLDNKIEYVAPDEEGFGYVALFNASDMRLEEAWMGMNDAGFAVMNTASYNIKDDKVPEKQMDKEGVLMTNALRTCRSVDDFARLLDSYPRPMGVEANFGVIDAQGNGAYFETNNHSYVRYNLDEAPDGVLVRTNYSHSGRKGEGYGFVREANAECLLEQYAASGTVTPELLTEKLSRTFYHDGKKQDFTLSGNRALLDEDFIPRFKSTATVAIEGCLPVESLDSVSPEFVKGQYIMWSGLGYPPASEIRAVRCAPDGVPEGLSGTLPGGHAPLCDKANAVRNKVITSRGKKGARYIDMSLLFNPDSTGYAQKVMKENHEVYRRETLKRDGGED